MNNIEKYSGVFPAFYACYDDNGAVSPERTSEFAEFLINKGVRGLYVCGSSGECIYQSVRERKLILEQVVAAAKGRAVVIAHVAANNTQDSMELAAHAESVGVNAIAAIPPIYFHLSEAAIVEYWNDISRAAPLTDFFIYNIPQLAGVGLTEGLLRKMMENPKLAGVKNSSMPVQDIQLFKAVGGEDFVVFNGPDEQFVGGRAMGACGGIGGTYAVMPELFLEADRQFKNGNIEKAKEIQYAINDIIAMLCSVSGSMYAAAKEVLRMQGIDIGKVRKPLPELAPGDLKRVADCYAAIQRAILKYSPSEKF